jgi:hypothetical protein
MVTRCRGNGASPSNIYQTIFNILSRHYPFLGRWKFWWYTLRRSMSPKAIALLSNPHPCGHIVYPYTDEALIAQAVTLYATAGIKNGEGVILVATPAHLQAIDHRLASYENLDTNALQASGRLMYSDADDMLPRFMVNSIPDEKRFKDIFRQAIETTQAAVTKNEQPGLVRAFGEMVSLVLADSVQAAELLESFWDDLIKEYSISLLCSYTMTGAQPLAHSLADCHGHNLAHLN